MGFLGRAIFNFVHAGIGSATVFLYPLYESKKALEKPSSRDHQEWLTYWVLLSFVTLLELYFSTIISWIPIWPYIKLVICLWLVLPSFKGAAYVFENIAMKFMEIDESEEIKRPEYEFIVEKKKEEKEDKLVKEDDGDDDKVDKDRKEKEEDDHDNGDDETKIFRAWKLVDDYIEQNGADSLEMIVKSALQAKEAKN